MSNIHPDSNSTGPNKNYSKSVESIGEISKYTIKYKCSLVIPTKNGGELFHNVVNKLSSQTYWNEVEFIVIDSGSTDNTIAIALSAGATVHKIDPEKFNHGETRDYGISLTTCDKIILMVQDALPNDNLMIENLLSALSEEGVGGVYARQIPRSTADVITKRNLNSWLTGRLEREVRLLKSHTGYESLPPIEKYFFCNFDNVCSAIRKEVWKKAHFGRTSFGEDIDWAERILKMGYKIIYEPLSAVIHSHTRPISYEYKRTYVCHRKLHQQFGLQLVPTLKGMARSWVHSTLVDIKFIHQMEKRCIAKLKMILKMPVLNFFSALAQYKAVKDDSRRTIKEVRGV